ncbi:MAG: dihydrodipicolinate synthase family protein, partial [Deltaproteobacteria bacterium]
MQGVLAPVLTPFDRDLNPDPTRFVKFCRALLDEGCDGLAPFGTTSEANSLSLDERERLLDALLESGLPPQKLIPGTGCCALPDTVRLSRKAARAGCAGVLMLPPFYYKGVTEEGLFRSFAQVIDRAAEPRLRVYLYHIPQVSQVGIPLAV